MKHGERIVAMTNYNGRIMVATETAVFDLTSGEPVPVTTIEVMNKIADGYKYQVTPIKEIEA